MSADVIAFPAGGYRYLKGVFQYSAGVAAEPGFEIHRVRFTRLLPLLDGFRIVEQWLAAVGRPTTAFCACELRSPEPFSDQGFIDFNRGYVQTLERWGIYKDGVNPVARTNVCPEFARIATPSLHAFAYTVPATAATRSFIVAGGGEAIEGKGSYRERTIRYGDTSPEGMRAKVRHVAGEMERRLFALGFAWQDVTSLQAYTVHDIGALAGPEIMAKADPSCGLSWHFSRPPVAGLDFEMDLRRPAQETLLAV
jgi:hypothetical protein